MKLDELIKQQEKRGLKKERIKTSMQSYEEYLNDSSAPRPYNTSNVIDIVLSNSSAIRDTKSADESSYIKDTKIASESSAIRDTKSINEPSAIRDTKSNRVSVNKGFGRPPKAGTYSYFDLTGNAKKIIDEIILICFASGVLQTEEINKIEFSAMTKVKIGAIKTTIYRLKEKGVIVDYHASKGRNASWKFELSKYIYDQYLEIRRRG